MFRQIITCSIAGTALVIVAARGQAQTMPSNPSPIQNNPAATAAVSMHVSVPIVADLALVTTGVDGSQQSQSGRFYRSIDGKIREDSPAGSVITDPKAGTITTLNPATGQAIVRSTPGPKGRYVSRPPLSATPSINTIGQATVEGHPVVITFITLDAANSRTAEIWTATDLRLTVLHKSTSLDGRVSSRQYQNIQSIEPDPGLFTVPPNYTVILNPSSPVSTTTSEQQ